MADIEIRSGVMAEISLWRTLNYLAAEKVMANIQFVMVETISYPIYRALTFGACSSVKRVTFRQFMRPMKSNANLAMADIFETPAVLWRKSTDWGERCSPLQKLWRKFNFSWWKLFAADPLGAPALLGCSTAAARGGQSLAFRERIACESGGRERLPAQFVYKVFVQRFDRGFHKVEERSGFFLHQPAVDRSPNGMPTCEVGQPNTSRATPALRPDHDISGTSDALTAAAVGIVPFL